MISTSARLARHVGIHFGEDAAEAMDLLGRSTHTERVKGAVLLAADGQIDRLRDGLALADTDWRDALMLTHGTEADLSGADWQDVLDDEFGPAPTD